MHYRILLVFFIGLFLPKLVVAQLPVLDLAVTQNRLCEDGSLTAKVEIVSDTGAHEGIFPQIAISGAAVEGRHFKVRGRNLIRPGTRQASLLFVPIDNNEVDGILDIVVTLLPSTTDLPGPYVVGEITQATLEREDDETEEAAYDPPTSLFGFAPSAGVIRLTWVDTTGASTYDIQRSTDNANFQGIAEVNQGLQTFDDTGVSEAITYYYRLIAKGSLDDSLPTGSVSVTATISLPAVPTALVASNISIDSMDLTWTINANNATEQRIVVDSSEVATIPAGDSTYALGSLTQNTAYNILVRAVNAAGTVDSTSINETTLPVALSPPENLVLVQLDVDEVQATWTLPTAGLDNVKLQFDTGVDFPTPDEVLLPSDTVTYIRSGLAQNQPWWFRVATVDGAQQSAWTTERIDLVTGAPDQPVLTLTTQGQTEILASWPVVSGAIDYQIEFWQSGSGSTNTVSGITTTQNLFTGLSVATSYESRVRARDSGGFGPFSTVQSASTAGAISLGGSASGLTVSLLASTVAGATEYAFERRDYAQGQFVEIARQASTSYTDDDYGTRLIIPAYKTIPSDVSNAVLAAGGDVVGWVIPNINSGPGTSALPAYTTFIDSATALGIKVLGYVATTFGARSLPDVYVDIDRWDSFYGVTDIFIDESGVNNDSGSPASGSVFMSLQDSLDYYQAIRDHIQAQDPNGTMTMNAGFWPISFLSSQYWFDGHSPVNIFEDEAFDSVNPSGGWLQQAQPSHYQNYPPSRLTALIRDSSFDRTVEEVFDYGKKVLHVGGMFVEPASSEAWKELPSNWDEQVQQISKLPDNTTLEYRVKALFPGGAETEYSAVISLVTGDDSVTPPNVAPTISLTAPADGAGFVENAIVNLTATASDSDGSVQHVEFFVNTTSIQVDTSNPYSASWVATPGSITLTATATDNQGATTSDSVTITVTPIVSNPPPTSEITSPSNGATFDAGDTVSIVVAASDDGFINKVDFLNGGTIIGTDNSPDAQGDYTFDWVPAAGSYTLFAIAEDNVGATTTSDGVSITVNSSSPPPQPDPEATFFISATGGTGAGTEIDPWHYNYAGSGADGRIEPGMVIQWLAGRHNMGSDPWRIDELGTDDQPVRWIGAPGFLASEVYSNIRTEQWMVRIEDYNYLQNIRIYHTQGDNDAGSSSSKSPGASTMSLPTLTMEGVDVKLINCVIHDVAQVTHFSGSTRGIGGEIYGTLIFNTGWHTTAAGVQKLGFGACNYAQNSGNLFNPTRPYTLNNSVLLSGCNDYQFQFQGTEAAFTTGLLVKDCFIANRQTFLGWNAPMEEVDFLGNVCFDSRIKFSLNTGSGSDIDIDDNLFYYKRNQVDFTGSQYGNKSLWTDYQSGFLLQKSTNVRINDNTFIRPTQAQVQVLSTSSSAVSGSGNAFWGDTRFEVNGSTGSISAWNSLLGGEADTHQGSGTPASNHVRVIPNAWENKRANIYVINFEGSATESIDFSSFMEPGDDYEVFDCYDIQNGTDPNVSIISPVPILTGTYSGAPVAIPLNSADSVGMKAISVHGLETWFWHDDEANAFIVVNQ